MRDFKKTLAAIALFLLFPGEIWYVPMSMLLTNLAVSFCLLVRIQIGWIGARMAVGARSGALRCAGRMIRWT